MKRTIKEAMKHINFLEQHINKILEDEQQNNYVIFLEGETPEESDYDFNHVTSELKGLQQEVLHLRKAINQANQEVLVGIKDYTISDALIRIAQLTNTSNRYRQLAACKQKSRTAAPFSTVVEYNLRLYDVKEAQKLYFECVEEIHRLQTAVDKANILTEINC